MEHKKGEFWFAMSATYNRQLKAKRIFDERGMENFIPMRAVLKIVNKKKIIEYRSIVSNLIFVKSEHNLIQELKNTLPYLQFLVDHKDKKRTPLIIKDAIMENFIAVVNSFDKNLEYTQDSLCNLTSGMKVRVKRGRFNGIEGVYVKKLGAKKHKLLVGVKNLVNVVINNVSESSIEILE